MIANIIRSGKYEGKEFKEKKHEKKSNEEMVTPLFSPKSPGDDLFQIKIHMMDLENYNKELEEKLKEKDLLIEKLKKENEDLKRKYEKRQ